jgi:acyl dehydratase
MAIPNRYILHQAPVIAALGETVLSALFNKASGGKSPVTVPGPEIIQTIPPRPKDLLRDYVRHVGGTPSTYKRVLPAHLFPQWGFPLAAKSLIGLDYPLQKVLNAGCRMEINEPLPNNEPLRVCGRLESIDDNGRRVLIITRVATGTPATPEALVGNNTVLAPLGGGKGAMGAMGGSDAKKKTERPRVPHNAREIGFWTIGSKAGLEFAKLTGDFNPVHWVRPYAQAFGFRNCILHGFSTMARAMEGLTCHLLSGNAGAIRTLEVKFTSPLVLPAKVGLYLATGTLPDQGPDALCVYVGDAPGGRAFLTGTYELRTDNGASQ